MRLPSIRELAAAAYDAGLEFDPAEMPSPAAVEASNALRGLEAVVATPQANRRPPACTNCELALARSMAGAGFEASDLREPTFRAFV